MIKNADDIIQSVPIDRVIMKYVDLRTSGANYQACCPFHEEKTPSFSVSPAKGIFKCFGCGKAGNAAKFIMEHDKVSFPEAVEIIANIGHMKVEYDKNRDVDIKEYKEQKAEKQAVIDAMTNAYSSIQFQLPFEDNESIEIYPGQVFSVDTLKKFNVTFAGKPDFRKSIVDQLIKIGWWRHNQFFFHDRILFPIHDYRGQIRGISARNLTGDKPKYINSTDSKVFNKSKLLFGLHLAIQSINKKEFVYLVEGPTDVMRMHEAGFTNTVGTMGAVLTEDQIRLIHRYTDTVVQCYDGDAAGRKASVRNAEMFLEFNINSKTIVLSNDDDPDTFLKNQGTEEFKKLEYNAEDSLLWLINLQAGDTAHDEAAAIDYAANLISKVDSDVKRDYYIHIVYKTLNTTKANLNKAVKDKRTEYISNQKQLSAEQSQMALNYGVYIDKHRYFVGDNAQAIEVSNFIFNPLFLVMANNYSIRLVQIINNRGKQVTIEVDSDHFVELTSVKKVVEAKGNFVFAGSSMDWIRVKKLLYENTPTCYPITTLGYHNAGFWSWGNGITLPDGTFKKVDRYGVVRIEDIAYYLPTFSEIKLDVHSDDVDMEDDPGEYYIYKKPSNDLWEDWTKLFMDVYGNNGMIAMAHYFLTIFRDLIYRRYRFFPHLNLFGPQGSGKSTIGWSLIAMFGKVREPMTIDQVTDVAMYRRVAQCRNTYAWLEEFTLECDKRKIAAMKGFYDGNGRQRGKKSNTNATETTPVNSAVIISGQVLPSQDPALLERCLTLYFHPMNATKQQEINLENLRDMEGTGELSDITAQLFQFRDFIDDNFSTRHNIMKDAIKDIINFKVKTRVLNNYVLLLTICDLLQEKVNLPFNVNDLGAFIIDRMKAQTDAVKGSDELQGWWVIFKYLLEIGLIGAEDFAVQEHVESLTVMNADTTTRTIAFTKPKRLLFFRYDKAYPMYRENAKKQGVERVLQLESLKFYIKVNESYIGEVKAKRLGGKVRKCTCLDADLLPVDIDSTKFTHEEGDHMVSLTSDTIKPGAIENMSKSDLFNNKNPFDDEKEN